MNVAEEMKNLTELSYKKRVDETLKCIYEQIKCKAKEAKNELWVYIPCIGIDRIKEIDIKKIVLILKNDGFEVGYPAGYCDYGMNVGLVIRW